jgi:hypothetical protein
MTAQGWRTPLKTGREDVGDSFGNFGELFQG